MLSQLERLSCEVDGRYASDIELQFLTDYLQTFNLRVQTYQKLQEVETALVQQAYAKIRSLDPDLFKNGTEDISGKWKRDTLRVLRYTAIAVLMDDPETLRERFLLWFQTIMRAFNAERGCNTTYAVLQDVVKQNFPAAQANIICPILELNRRSLGVAS
jgi:Phycobilisome protein